MGCQVHACVRMASEISSVCVEHKGIFIFSMKREQTSENAYIYQCFEDKGISRFGVHSEGDKHCFRIDTGQYFAKTENQIYNNLELTTVFALIPTETLNSGLVFYVFSF